MKFFRHLLGITKLDKEKNQCIRQKTGAQNIVKEIKQYQEKWLQHVQRMDTDRIPKQALQYKPNGRRNIGRPRKRWRDQLHLEDQETGNMPNPSWTWWWWWNWASFLRHLLGITKLDKEKNQCIRQKTGAQNIVKEIKQHREKWLKHVQRMDTNRLPKQTLQYKPKGRRNIRRSRKRWRDQLHL